MTTITCTYTGDGETKLVHGPTGSVLETDLPPDNGGKGRRFFKLPGRRGGFDQNRKVVRRTLTQVVGKRFRNTFFRASADQFPRGVNRIQHIGERKAVARSQGPRNG